MSVQIIHDDCRVAMRRLIDDGVQIDSCCCDPPYFLESIVKRFGKEGSAAAKHGTDGRFTRASKGFMGSKWDGADADGYRVTEDPEVWRLVYELLKPGGFLLAFSSPRTGHRMACAIEDSGFIMHPFIGWAYAQGFPKAHAVQKGNGWFYGTQTLKPALEPIYMAQRPFSEKTGFANVLLHGVGALNIDGCRVPTEENLNGGAYSESRGRTQWGTATGVFAAGNSTGKDFVQPVGRWPANLVHDGSDEVLACFPESGGQQGASSTDPGSKTSGIYHPMSRESEAMQPRGDTGSAARFFNTFPIFYHAKATKADRAGSRHPTVKPVALMRHLIRLVTPPGGLVLDPFAGSGTTGQAAEEEGCSVILIEREAGYVSDIHRRFRNVSFEALYWALL